MVTKQQKNILVADDSEFFREKIAGILKDAGHSFELVTDGVGVLERLKNQNHGFNALLLDIQMPNMDGFQVLDWLRLNGRIDLPAVCISSVHDTKEVSERVMKVWGRQLLSKSISDAKLLSTLNRAIFGFPEKNRAYTQIPAQYIMGTECLHTSLLDISAEGAFLHGISERIKSGTTIKLKFMLFSSKLATIFPTATVQWSSSDISLENRFSGHGIKFNYLTPGEKNLIKDFAANSSSVTV